MRRPLPLPICGPNPQSVPSAAAARLPRQAKPLGGQNPEEEFGGQIIETLSHHKSTPGKLFEHTQISVKDPTRHV